MILTLKTKNGSQECIKKYLEENASPELAKKINNGVPVQKDGKTVINKKDLDGFWAYASQKARATKESYTENEVVFGWAMDYFNDDSIIGTLYTEDGKKYNAPKTTVQPVPAPTVTPPKPQPKPQLSMFDLIPKEEEQPQPTAIEETDDEEPTEEEIHEAMDELAEEEQRQEVKPSKPTGSPVYQKYMEIQNKYPDAIVVYRLGDFYEVFGDNAKTIANELDLTLTGRDCGLAERIPMIGFPYHAADSYIQKIVDCGYKVAVTENLNEVRISEPAPIEEEPSDGKHWIDDKTYVDDEGEVHNVDEEEELKQALEFAKAFDKNALAILYEIFNNEIDLQ